ncbi:MAG: biotin-dependent carboxyltransferase family protein, partial [Firmicutes bacterium]|nr:biotin-dependent carboxyltransferase family protein [Bacillota bacterium]
MAIIIENPGLLTSVQDAGRFGMQRYGMSPAGAMDLDSMKLANILAGNDPNTGTLECTYMGPAIRFEEDEVIAIAGADMAPTVDGQPVPMWQAFCVPAGSTLTTGGCRNGCRSYIAFAGGLDIPVLDGSQSTFLRSGLGGLEGRKLRAGDRIGLRAPQAALKNMVLRTLPRPQRFKKNVTVRVIPGPQDDRFTEAGLNTLYTSQYRISEKSDRMGFRTEGPEIEHVNNDANILSDGIPYGAIQVPKDGKPIIMMSEHAGSGGYTKVGTVISVDMPLVAQLAPGG